MSQIFDTPVSAFTLVLLVFALLVACGFEFVNGFHDTANAVATVIYTKSLRPWIAVIWSGLCNFLGVALGGIAVAMGIIKLLPAELLVSSGSGAGLAMVLALLVAAILWNLGTWWFGLPASSSHTLIGAIIGVGLANSMLPGHTFGSGVNWHKAQEIGLSLILSPIVGLAFAGGLVWLARKFIPKPELHEPPVGDKPPPGWIRGLLIATCTGVSFSHGSNDGQKGVGLIMLILIGILPADFALNQAYNTKQFEQTVAVAEHLDGVVRDTFGVDRAMQASNDPLVPVADTPQAKVIADLAAIRVALQGKSSTRDIPSEQRFDIRAKILGVDAALGKLEKGIDDGTVKIPAEQAKTVKESLKKDRASLRDAIDYAPRWVLVLVALSLGVGTMIGWKRIVVTVGEKIGKSHLTYSQGASAELVAASTIALAGKFGLPVSTTHVLSSGIAGTMVAGKSGLQKSTVRNIAMAWLLTLPVSIVLAGTLFLLFRLVTPAFAAAATPPAGPGGGAAAVAAVAVTAPVTKSAALRLHGSSTIGADLAPALAEGFLRQAGAVDVTRSKTARGWRISAKIDGADRAIEIDALGTATGFDDLVAGKADVAMASRRVAGEELDRASGAKLGDLAAASSEHVLAVDGIAVIVHPSNGVAALALDDVRKLFTGETRSWPNGHAVHVKTRDEQSGTYDTFKGLVLAGREVAGDAEKLATNDALALAVSKDPDAIGFASMGARGGGVGVKALAVREAGARSIAPTPTTVATEDYPLSRRLYLYTPAKIGNALAAPFVTYALSAEGQRVVSAVGFVDLTPRATDEDACTVGCPDKYVAATRGARRLSLDFRFLPASAELDSRAQKDVERLADFARLSPGEHLMLLGFSDADGARDANARLSLERAKRVAEVLAAHGVKATKVDGYGEAMPVASNATAAGRDRNRRVEVWSSN